jgi:uncharacterized protein YjiS (DUF1127 family)
MAMIDVSSQYLALAPLAGFPEVARAEAPVGTLKQLAARFLAWRAQRETIRLLNSVDPATLRDLGITDIESQVYGDPTDRMRGYDPDWWKRGAA